MNEDDLKFSASGRLTDSDQKYNKDFLCFQWVRDIPHSCNNCGQFVINCGS